MWYRILAIPSLEFSKRSRKNSFNTPVYPFYLARERERERERIGWVDEGVGVNGRGRVCVCVCGGGREGRRVNNRWGGRGERKRKGVSGMEGKLRK